LPDSDVTATVLHWPDEPDEDDPEDRWPDPERELPSVPEAPSVGVDIPRVGTPESEVDAGTQQAFWTAVVLANVGVAGATIGPLVAYFRGELLVGAGAFALGALALGRTYLTVREFRAASDGDNP
jgi:hypothetical protein